MFNSFCIIYLIGNTYVRNCSYYLAIYFASIHTAVWFLPINSCSHYPFTVSSLSLHRRYIITILFHNFYNAVLVAAMLPNWFLIAIVLISLSSLSQVEATPLQAPMLPSCNKPFTPFVYKGCFTDTGRNLHGYQAWSNDYGFGIIYNSKRVNMLPDECVAFCKGESSPVYSCLVVSDVIILYISVGADFFCRKYVPLRWSPPER